MVYTAANPGQSKTGSTTLQLNYLTQGFNVLIRQENILPKLSIFFNIPYLILSFGFDLAVYSYFPSN